MLANIYKHKFLIKIMFIKEIFEGKNPAGLHTEFLKFGKGEYRNKYIIEAKKQKDKYAIKTTNEFANYLVRKCLEDVPEKVKFSGAIISTFDLRNEVSFPIENVKQFMGVKQIQINTEINKREILNLMNKYPKVFFALSFSTPNSELKIKAKAPKSAKPSTSGEKEVSADFCSLKTSNYEIVKELFFDSTNFNEIRVSHTIKITEIDYPKNETDPVKIRENSIRKGEIVRILDINGRKEEKTACFAG